MTRKKTALWIFVCLFLATLAGCARAPRRAPSLMETAPVAAGAPMTHRVAPGETLYHIAKLYRVDANDLMRANSIQHPNELKIGQTLTIPGHFTQASSVPVIFASGTGVGMTVQEIRSLLGSPNTSSDWRTITLHHSATSQGSAKLFHRDHARRHMGGLFYHFVLGNGTYTPDGQVEIGWRWKKQIKANRPYDIQICLVGDFSKTHVSAAQFESLVNLVRVLCEDYHIRLSNIRRHRDIRGKHTECPGQYFPFDRVVARLREAGLR